MDVHDALMDVRSEARYVSDPGAEPDTREVAEAAMRGGGSEPATEDDRV